MDPFSVAGIISGGLGVLNSFMGKDPDEENLKRMQLQQNMFDQRMHQATAAQGNWKGFYDDAMAVAAPRLAFADRQAGLAASAGAQRAQANMRRTLGAGNPLGEALASGITTGVANQQNTLRALATSDIISQAQRMAQARAGLIAGSPVAQVPMYTGQKNMMNTGLLGNLATSLGVYGQWREDQKRSQPNRGPGSGYGGPF